VMTNAHVVAGTDETSVEVINSRGRTREMSAAVISYDPSTDLAVLYVRGLQVSPLQFAADPAAVGDNGIVLGYPLDGPFTPTAAKIRDRIRWQPIRAIWGVVAAIELVDAPGHVLEAAEIEIEPGSGDGAAVGEPAAPSEAGVDFSLVTAGGSSSLGSTFLPFEPEPAAWLPAIRRVGARYVPGVADAPLLALRHCARPFSTDGRPLVGAVSGIEGLWVAAGHGPWGISTGPGSARLVADLILGRTGRAAIPTALDPNRFGAIQRQESGSNR